MKPSAARYMVSLMLIYLSVSLAEAGQIDLQNASYGPDPGYKGERTEITNPGWHESLVSTPTEVVQYLERAAGSPIARHPDVGLVTSYSPYATLEVEPAVAMSQHPLEAFGWEKPARLGVRYANLPQNSTKFLPVNKMRRDLRSKFWETQ
jgi:hypothetical protein